MSEQPVKPCLLPWIALGTNPFGKTRPCGYSKFKGTTKVQKSTIAEEFNNDLFRSIRRDFLAGKWPENCERCKFAEQTAPGHSKKSDSDIDLPEFGHLFDLTRPDGSVDHYPKVIDIRLGTVCNLKCIHCGTGNSNKWNEDKELLNKYPNTKIIDVDNSWIDRPETPIWKDIYDHLPEIKKFYFIGGEPFASVQHNKFVESVSQTEYAKDIILHYVTNGVLLTDRLWEIVQRFKDVVMNVSIDGSGDVLEFFRYPIKADRFEKRLKSLEANKRDDIDLSAQWTSSNISLYYLPETIDYFEKTFSKVTFRLRNFVDFPSHMSAQNLPKSMKPVIERKLEPYREKYPEIEMYVRQMNDGDLWRGQGQTFLNYLEDLSRVRNLDWKESLKEFHKDLYFHMNNEVSNTL